MAGSTEILQEYLVKLGFQTDSVSLRKFEDGMGKTGKRIMGLGLTVAGVVASVEAASAAFAYSMRKVYYESELSGSTVKNINAMTYAGEQFGISAGSMESAIKSMGQAMAMDPGKMGLLNSLTGMNEAGKDATDQMLDLMTALKKMNAPEYAKASFAAQFGIDTDTYRLMSAHLDEIKKKRQDLLNMYKESGVDPDKAKKTMLDYASALDRLETRFSMLGQKVLITAQPAFDKFADILNKSIDGWMAILDGKLGHPPKGSFLDKFFRWTGLESNAATTRPAAKVPNNVHTIHGLLPGEAQRTEAFNERLKKRFEHAGPFSGDLSKTPLAAMISKGEGGYSSVNLGEAGGYRSGTMNLAGMTLDQVMAAQAAHQFNAAGKYQIIGKTLAEAKKALGLKGSELFDPALQDKIFSEYLIKMRHPEVLKALQGKGSIEEAQLGLSKEWASIADPRTGKSYYAGVGNNRALTSAEEAKLAIEQTRLGMGGRNGPTQVAMNTTINVQGTGAEQTAKAVAREQKDVNAYNTRMMRNAAV